jgi:hypothetical protein
VQRLGTWITLLAVESSHEPFTEALPLLHSQILGSADFGSRHPGVLCVSLAAVSLDTENHEVKTPHTDVEFPGCMLVGVQPRLC